MDDTITLSQRLAQRVRPKPWYVQLWRLLIIWLINAVALQLAIFFLPGVTTTAQWSGIFLFTLLIAALNAFVRPTLVKLTLPITMMTLGFVTFFINGFMFIVANWLLPILQFGSLWQAVLLSFVMTLITWLGHVLLSIDDTDSYYYSVVQRMGKAHRTEKAVTDTPGFLYFEIDGLSAPVLQEALASGVMPTLQQLLDESHRLVEWETDLPAQTCSSQLGILHGNNRNAIGFRWYDRSQGRMFTASNPTFVDSHEQKITDGKGLLSHNGASIGNMFTGDAAITAFTTSASGRKQKTNPYDPLSYYFINPYNYVHTVVMVLWEILLEFKDDWLQERQDRRPRIKRDFKSALMRAFMCRIVPDIAIQTAIGELYAGRDAIYLTYAGYDEMSHLAGLNRPESLRALRHADRALLYLLLAIKESPRPYQIVLLSDHGQSMGWTFEHLFNTSFGEVVKAGCTPDADMREMAGVDEVGIVIGDILTDIRKSLRSKLSLDLFWGIVKTFSRSTPGNDAVVVDTAATRDLVTSTSGFDDLPNILLQVGGNLAMIYFTDNDTQLELTEIVRRQPKLVATLAAHPGISLVMVKSAHGPLVLSRDGMSYLDWDGSGERTSIGKDPLTLFGPHTAQHLLRVAAATTCPDILALSAYDSQAETIVGFEPQCGAHGGLGGPQNRPFLLYPRSLAHTDKKIVGAEQIHHQLMAWQRQSRRRAH